MYSQGAEAPGLSTDVRAKHPRRNQHCSNGPMRPLPTTASADVALGAFLHANLHAFTRAELLARWPRSTLDLALREGGAVRLLPNAYCGRDHVRDPVVMGEAVSLWLPSGLVTGALALSLYSPTLTAPSSADVLVQHGSHLRAPRWVRLHQTGLPRTSGNANGVHCVAPERALLDAWRFAVPTARRPLLYEALWARTCSWRQLAAELRRTPRVRARRELEGLLAWFAKGATSPLEVQARRDVFAGRSFRDLEWQASLTVGSRRAVADMLHRAAKVVVELDGARYHDVPSTWRSDRARDVDLAAAGYVTIRFGWDDIVRRPEWCRMRLIAVLASRGVRPVST
jgi:very-short-patch-repair endonuclease